jgi:hypothetical protein
MNENNSARKKRWEWLKPSRSELGGGDRQEGNQYSVAIHGLVSLQFCIVLTITAVLALAFEDWASWTTPGVSSQTLRQGDQTPR